MFYILEQNLISSCKEQTNFDPQRTIDSNYSILEVETPRIFVRDNDENEYVANFNSLKSNHNSY